jgi:hypothetical protein
MPDMPTPVGLSALQIAQDQAGGQAHKLAGTGKLALHGERLACNIRRIPCDVNWNRYRHQRASSEMRSRHSH